ncbi:hypothetical protein AB7813_03725 [Tardiphaga sp. 20_F10_N6_6]|uniref:hypothetical protein n=1 Tax=Tardiphaga sp. 20_F10_N6_6 TaxID=3240788 RepID=UPI003F8CC7ED
MAGPDPEDVLRKLSEGYRTIRFARGVVGKTGHAAIGLLTVWAIVAWQIGDNLTKNLSLLAVGTLASAVFVWWARSTQKFAEKNPAQALLEGAELLEYQRFEAETKGLSSPNVSPRIPDPTKDWPTIDELPVRPLDNG